MKTTTFFLLIVLLLSITACKKDALLKSVTGTYVVSETHSDPNGTNITTYGTLRISKTIRSEIRVKFESVNRDYVLIGENENSYSFGRDAGMDCLVGEDFISIGRNNDSIQAAFFNSSYGFVTGVKVEE